MNTINKISTELESLVSHVNDSIKGYEMALKKADEANAAFKDLLVSNARERAIHAGNLNSRLKCIGEDEETSGSLSGAAHRALITVRDMFSSNEPEAILEECIRGEKKLLEYIGDSFSEVNVMDGATQNALADLTLHVTSSIKKLENASY